MQIGFYLALLALIGLGALWRPEIAVTGVLSIFGLKQWGQTASPFLAAHGTFTNIAIGLIVLCAILVRLARGQCVFCNIRRSTWVVMGLYAYAFLSLTWTPRLDLASNVWLHDAPYVLTVVFLAPLCVSSAKQLEVSYRMLVIAGGVLVLALLVLGKWGNRGLLMGEGNSDMETNPLAIAALAGSVASAAMFVGWRRFAALGWVVRLLVVAACLAVIIRSGSRGQFIAALAALVVMLPIGFQISRVRGFIPIIVGVVVIAAATAYAATNYIRRDDARWDQSVAQSAVSTRLEFGRKVLSAWTESPFNILFGLGNSASYDPRILGGYPHNVALETLAEEGLVGIAVYLQVIWLAGRGLFEGLRIARQRPEIRGVLAASSANFLFSLVISLKEGSMISSSFYFLAALLLARIPELALADAGEPAAAQTPAAPMPAGPVFANMMR